MTYTTEQAAQTLGVARRTVLKYCKALRIEKHGRDYLLGDAQVQLIAAAIQQARPGRPARRTYDK